MSSARPPEVAQAPSQRQGRGPKAAPTVRIGQVGRRGSAFAARARAWHRARRYGLAAWVAGLLALLGLGLVLLLWVLDPAGPAPDGPAGPAASAGPVAPAVSDAAGRAGATAAPSDPQLLARGAYLARAGNCAGCHTAPGGAAYAGGRGISTPFGTVFAGNLTPDAQTGLGRWSSDDFWRALHHGLGRDGRRLVPAFPYTAYTLVSRADSDALWAHLRSLPPVVQANRPHALRFPFNTAAALAAWRVLYFSPGEFQPEPAQSADWNRGAYLVRGLGHCAACHGARDPLGGLHDALQPSGGLLPGAGWYAPSLLSAQEAGLADWPLDQITQLLRTGRTEGASTLGPMAEVVLHSTQHLGTDDLRAMAVYLKALPGPTQAAPARPAPAPPADAQQLALGARLYQQQCAACHGPQGQGAAGAYPALAGNRAVTLAQPVNLIRLLLQGGFSPATAGHPRPYGMPPMLGDDAELAAVLSHLRQAWGHQASAVSAQDVRRVRDAAR